MMQRKFLRLMCMIALLISLIGVQAPMVMAAEETVRLSLFENIDYQKSPEIRAIIDGRQVNFDVSPQLVNGRVLVPMRAIFEAFGLTLSWDGAARTAQGTSNDASILFAIGSNKAVVNGEERMLDVPAGIIQGKTMIPVRFLSENMGYHVVWIKSSNLILISKSDIVEWRYNGYETIEPYKEYEYKYINGTMTKEMRYTGENYDLQFYNLFSADGRVIPNVPEYNLAQYGAGWNSQSPFDGRTFWVDMDTLNGTFGSIRFYNESSFSLIKADLLKNSAPAGNYLKVKIEDHYFNLNDWEKTIASPVSPLYGVMDDKSLDGMEIASGDTLIKATINDKYNVIMGFESLKGVLTGPDTRRIYAVLDQDPRKMFDWSDNIWQRLKGETPWTSMSGDMLLIQKLSKPDQMSKITTKSAVLELWVYETDFGDSVYYFKDWILTAMW